MSDAGTTALSQLVTRWTLLVNAHRADTTVAREAQSELLPRYCAAIYRYVLAVLRDPSAAEEVCQEFAFRFVRGDFRHARPERGRFRDYVKVAVVNLIADYRRRGQFNGRLQPLDSGLAADSAVGAATDAKLEAVWREALINLAWAGLERESTEGRLMLHEVLWLKAEDPERRSADIAAELTRRHGRPFTAANARQMLHRARERFAELLRKEVADSLPSDDSAAIEAELAELGLAGYCLAARPPG